MHDFNLLCDKIISIVFDRNISELKYKLKL